MANYQKQVSMGGTWVKAADLQNGTKAKLVSETVPQPSTYLDKQGNPKTQDVAKIRIQGHPEPYNVALNRATINALVDAFGEDSKAWMNQVLTVETEKVRIGGKSVVALYLLPEGYVKYDDENGYAVIAKQGTAPVQETPSDDFGEEPPTTDEDINVDDIPF